MDNGGLNRTTDFSAASSSTRCSDNVPHIHHHEQRCVSNLSRFAKWELFQQSLPLRELLNSDYAYPPQLWDDMHHESNGYAGNATHNRSSGRLNSKLHNSDLGVVDIDYSI